jgi:dCMP deaminase
VAKIGYAKISRSWSLDPAKATSIGGDIDVINALKRLAIRHPEHEFVLIGKNSAEDPKEFGYPTNVTNPWTAWRENWPSVPAPEKADLMVDHFRKISGDMHQQLDHMIVWAGQHGSANSRIPMIGSDWTTPPGTPDDDVITGGEGILATPQYVFVHYTSWLLDFISRWREAGPGPLYREEIWLCPDPRNYLKCREKRWPLRFPVLSQYDFVKYTKNERYGRFPPELANLDPTGYRENSLWVSNAAYCYAGLELTAVDAPEGHPFDPRPGPHAFGMVVNENLQGVKDNRLALLKSWILPNFPDAEIRGHWTEKSQLDLKKIIQPVPYPEAAATMKSFATTITTPASGSEWATAKPWECFALGSVCFFHPRYDGQGHILPLKNGTIGQAFLTEDSKMLAQYLRVDSAEQLKERVSEVTSNRDLFYAIVTAQRRHYEQAFEHWEGGTLAISQRVEADLERIGQGHVIMEAGNDYWVFGSDKPWLLYTQPARAKVSTRGEARPRGTSEERRKKAPPVSRRRALKDLPDETVVETCDKTAEDCRARFDHPSFKGFTAQSDGAYVETATGPRDIYSIGALSMTPPTIHAVKVVAFAAKETVRPSKDEYFLNIAKEVAKQTTCHRRAVGCVAVNAKKHILATGFNGVPRGLPHCNEGNMCKGAKEPSGKNLSDCLSVHAEINCLVQCKDVDDIQTVYLTVSPCRDCIKVIMNTGATRIVFNDEYVHEGVRELWLSRPGNEWICIP